jgi:NADH pyrophosphatase NudC (nudix superfamily)
LLTRSLVIPAGPSQVGEALESAVAREVQEEAGVKVGGCTPVVVTLSLLKQ